MKHQTSCGAATCRTCLQLLAPHLLCLLRDAAAAAAAATVAGTGWLVCRLLPGWPSREAWASTASGGAWQQEQQCRWARVCAYMYVKSFTTACMHCVVPLPTTNLQQEVRVG
jgi:hypothetical protein